MKTINEIGNAHETKFVLDAGKEFKAEAKRNKALGIWAAGLMGKPRPRSKNTSSK